MLFVFFLRVCVFECIDIDSARDEPSCLPSAVWEEYRREKSEAKGRIVLINVILLAVIRAAMVYVMC